MSSLSEMRPRSVALAIRFVLAGMLNAAFGFSVFAAFSLLGLEPGTALAASTCFGVGFNFFTSKRFVFQTRGRRVRFTALYIALWALNWEMIRLLSEIGISTLQAEALLVIPFAGMSFLGQKTFVFSSEATPMSEPSA